MGDPPRRLRFRSRLARPMKRFLAEKRACGYRYARGGYYLQSLDRFLVAEGLRAPKLPRALVESWTGKRAQERPTTQRARVAYVREFARFLVRHEYDAFIPPIRGGPLFRSDFVPHIFSRAELREILLAADRIEPHGNSRLRHLVVPELFRVLYGCGLRAGEARRLTVGDVDLAEGILHVRKGKFRKDRLVPVAPSLLRRLRPYASKLGERGAQAAFFPAPHGGSYSSMGLYSMFRGLLDKARIPHRGRGKGPRLHDLRHTFAVCRLVQWYEEGVDLERKLLALAAYMGHVGLGGTQRYLRLVPDLYPEVVRRQEMVFGSVIPSQGDA